MDKKLSSRELGGQLGKGIEEKELERCGLGTGTCGEGTGDRGLERACACTRVVSMRIRFTHQFLSDMNDEGDIRFGILGKLKQHRQLSTEACPLSGRYTMLFGGIEELLVDLGPVIGCALTLTVAKLQLISFALVSPPFPTSYDHLSPQTPS